MKKRDVEKCMSWNLQERRVSAVQNDQGSGNGLWSFTQDRAPPPFLKSIQALEKVSTQKCQSVS